MLYNKVSNVLNNKHYAVNFEKYFLNDAVMDYLCFFPFY